VAEPFVSTEARILQHPIFPSSCFSKFFSEENLSTQPLAPPISFWHLVNGRRILQRFKPLSTTSFTASDHLDRITDKPKPPPCQPGAFYTAFAPLQPLFLR
ncbi:hypothetical protein, partial [Pseudomonas borbori]|uniref:hypothetical protein n=1 Tax=Pseudomonas borbori TaxID=289003 RepID=UPI001BAEEDC6